MLNITLKSWWMWFIDETKELALLKTEKLEACGIHSFGFSQAVAGIWFGWIEMIWLSYSDLTVK